MRPVLFLGLLLLSACAAPHPHFRGVEVTRVKVDSYVFDIRVRRELAEALRIGAGYERQTGPLFRSAQVAIEVVSGCKVDRIGGDQVQITGMLDCPEVRFALPLSWYYTCGPAAAVGPQPVDIACRKGG